MEPLDVGYAISVWLCARWKGTRTSKTYGANSSEQEELSPFTGYFNGTVISTSSEHERLHNCSELKVSDNF